MFIEIQEEYIEKIDLDKWDIKEYFEFFKDFKYSSFDISFDLFYIKKYGKKNKENIIYY